MADDMTKMVRDTLTSEGAQIITFDRTRKHARVIFNIHGKKKKYTYPDRGYDRRMIENVRCQLRRLAREMRV